MKFNIEIDIDWIDCDEGLDEAIKNRVVNKISSEVVSKLGGGYQDSLKKVAKEHIDKHVNKILDDFLNQGFTPTNNWGEVQGETVSIKQMLKDKLDEEFNQKLGKDGKLSNYQSMPRYKFLLDGITKKAIEEFTTKLSKDVLSGIKKDINEEARQKITDAILRDYDLKKLI